MLGSALSYDEIEREIEKMQSPNPKLREESIDSLYKISKEIGQIYTVQYLLPFIQKILDTNEEAKVHILHQIEKVSREVLQEIKPVYPLYKEIFLTRDDTLREKAAESLVGSVVHISDRKIDYELYGLEEFICRLGESRFVMHRISAISLLRKCLDEIPQHVQLGRLKGLFAGLQKDPLSIVRRKSIACGEILLYFYTEGEIREIIEGVLQDEDDIVRSYFVSPLFLLDKTKENLVFNLKIFKKASGDSSWKVRSSSTKIIKDVILYVYAQGRESDSGLLQESQFKRGSEDEGALETSQESGVSVLECIDRLVEDKEDEVRRSIVERTPEILKEAPHTKNKILYIIDKASCDRSPGVREIVPNILSVISEIITKEDVALFISPIIKRLLVDEDQKTKMETIGKLKTLYSKLGTDAVTDALTPVINDLSSANWRTRIAVLKSISSLSRQMSKKYFYEYLNEPFFKVFIDPIWLVRKEAAAILAEISINFGAPWVCADMMQSLEFLKSSRHYAHRISYVTALGKILQTLWPRRVQKLLGKNLLEMADDPIPQVRLTVAKAARAGILEEKHRILKHLQDDAHPEVASISGAETE
ncbi:serine/threonine-protein phosphatase 2A regulatory subunit A [Nematocida major]|uniref:serine/threonine-protein phosphatase 2A regulatory subunit A n=1 Tax=Nematocida major TaxID=1912982 RepID=UPI0020073110|nr:serine/threonine-protein phosphatase 2A regulatory subunit A [Nematocida major]KAH9387152.1 serine/threonine-protein phosphatase 2A regulatory subunit A [Nematocida major]